MRSMYAMQSQPGPRMDPPHNVGNEPSDRQRLFDVDLFDGALADDLAKLAFARPEGFTRLVEAISPRNRSAQNSILRHWGIWR